MDEPTARSMGQALAGQRFGGWAVGPFLNHGKSAAVFKATREGEEAALKIFDPSLVGKFGREAQRKRVLREQQLVGKEHPHLIGIREAGEDHGHFFVVMDLFSGGNLEQHRGRIPNSKIQPLIAQVSSAAKFLEGLNLAHRDIKPENIGVSDDYDHAVLLDLGVIRPIDLAGITDSTDQKTFVGTLRYSPKELLFREEEDSTEGWRAVTFYQLGAVLHDLLTGRLLFEEHSNPYAQLVRAVEQIEPQIVAPTADPDLVLLARNCLLKSPDARLNLVSWDQFDRAPRPPEDVNAAQERIENRLRAVELTSRNESPEPSVQEALHGYGSGFENKIRQICAASREFPPFSLTTHTPTNDHICVSVRFAPSASHRVSLPFEVFVEISILDLASSALDVMIGCLCGSSSSECVRDLSERQLSVLFRGVYAEDSLGKRLRGFLILFLDFAQQASDSGSVVGQIWFDRQVKGGADA